MKIYFLCSYYLEILHQEYGGAASVNLALFKEKSSFTEDQTNDAVNEVQNIVAEYDVYDEEQVGGLGANLVLAAVHIQDKAQHRTRPKTTICPFSFSLSFFVFLHGLNILRHVRPGGYL